jgi:hypothetical protein
VEESRKSKRAETREFWGEAIRLWAESGLSVREFCAREGLAEYSFYSRRRELLPRNTATETNQESCTTDGDEVATEDRRRRRKRKPVAAADAPEATVSPPFVELVAPTSADFCHCTLELENTDGTKMRIQLRGTAVPDLAAISRSFWNHCG